MQIRVLTEDDAAAFRELRLRALREHPEAFASDAEDFASRPMSAIVSTLRQEDAGRLIVGAFVEGQLVGTIGLARDQGEKLRHKALIWGVYVAPEARGEGIGNALMQEAISRARALPGLESLYLGVAIDNTPARALYISHGFQVYGIELHAMKVDGKYVDEELMLLWLHQT